MSYIGRDISNLSDRVKLDQISTSSATTFNLTLNGNPFVPSSAESLTISLNAIIQSPQDSYTVSGSTVIFASSLQSSDVIDFILAERAITLTTIGSGTVNTSNIVNDAVTSAKINLTDELHINSAASGNTLHTLLKLETDGSADGSGITIDTRTAHTRGEINFLDGTGSYDSNYVFKTATGSQLATPTEKFRVTPTGATVTGDLLIGTTSAIDDRRLSLRFSRATHGGMVIENNDSADSAVHMLFKNTNGAVGNITVTGDLGVTDEMFIGTTATIEDRKLSILYSRASQAGILIKNGDSAYAAVHMTFQNTNGTVGTITVDGTSTAYATSSDYRLKENVDYTFDATTRLKQLKPARFNFIADADKTVDGFIAHEVSSVVPEAVTGEKDATEMQGIDQSKLVPLLVKTIQELEARITELENA